MKKCSHLSSIKHLLFPVLKWFSLKVAKIICHKRGMTNYSCVSPFLKGRRRHVTIFQTLLLVLNVDSSCRTVFRFLDGLSLASCMVKEDPTHTCRHTDVIRCYVCVQLPRLSALNLQDLDQICRPTESNFSSWLPVWVCVLIQVQVLVYLCGDFLCVHSSQTFATAFVSISLYSDFRQTSLGRFHHMHSLLVPPTHTYTLCGLLSDW